MNMKRRTRAINLILALSLVGSLVGLSHSAMAARGGSGGGFTQARGGGGGGGGTVTQRMEITDVFGEVIPCGGQLDNRGDVIVKGYATASSAGTYQFRVGYGVNGGNEAWYDNHYATLPAGTETLVLEEVQDIDPTVTSVTFTLNSVGKTKLSCSFGVSNVLSPSEGVISTRPEITDDLVDEIRVTAEEYATKQPITCGDLETNHLSRVRYTIEFFSDTDVWASVHTHIESPGKTGPDQNGDGLNNRWWEITTGVLRFVPANTWVTMLDITTAGEPGVNVLHAAEIAADGRRIETFCSYLT
jgi:hypothetical protein